MTTDPRDAEQARKALHKAEKEHCSNFDKGAVFHWAEKGAYVLKADAQAEIARLIAELAEAEAAAEGALMILVQTQAERDAALARETALLVSNQTNRDLLYQLTGAQSEVTHMRNRFDTAIAGAYEAAAQVEGYRYNTWGDKLPTKLHYSHQEAIRALTTANALAARDRRDAQMRAEGRKDGLRKAARMCETDDDIWIWDECRDAILAAAEREET